MEQLTKIDAKEIISRLAKIEVDMNYIKEHINKQKEEDKELEEEIKAWDKLSEQDTLRWEKENL